MTYWTKCTECKYMWLDGPPQHQHDLCPNCKSPNWVYDTSIVTGGISENEESLVGRSGCVAQTTPKDKTDDA